MTQAKSNAPQAPPLPVLREDLRVIRGSTNSAGERTWLIYDPVQHRYIQIDRRSYDIVSLWPGCADAVQLTARAKAAYGYSVTQDELSGLMSFIYGNQLALHQTGGWKDLWERTLKSRHGIWAWLVHHYLFFRIPLVRPEPFLRAAMPLVALIYTRAALAGVLAAGFAGLFLVSRQWSEFIGSAAELLSFDSIFAIGVSLFIVKALHEFGHAFTAFRFGCRVPSMGIAVMMMAPMLYTDVTDAWRIPSKRQRFYIGAAGVIVELALAAFATLAWALMAPGPLKSIALTIATVSWVMSLAFNLNPFMRFDGYYLLSDATGVENLQERSFALGVWKMRELLFALDAPRPEYFAPAKTGLLIGFAWGVWIYRALLFTGIALLVYHYAFKALGIVLFLIEIIYFIAGPVWRELKFWGSIRSKIMASRRAMISGLAACAAVFFLILPWSARIEVPAVLERTDLARIYPRRPAEIVSIAVKAGDDVEAGQVLATLAAPEIAIEKRLIGVRIAITRLRLARRTVDSDDREQSLVLERELVSMLSKLGGLAKEEEELTLRSPVRGQVLELNASLHQGRWIGGDELVALVGDKRTYQLRGYLGETDLWRAVKGAPGRFIPHDLLLPAVDVTLAEIATSGVTAIEIADLAGKYGGSIVTKQENENRLVPSTGQYLVRLNVPVIGWEPQSTISGVVQLEGARESPLGRAWRYAAGVLVRESGF